MSRQLSSNNNLQFYRRKACLTREQLADASNTSKNMIGHYERFERRPRLDGAQLIVRALNDAGIDCTLDDVFPLSA